MWSDHLLATWISNILLEFVMEHPRVLWLIWHGFGTYCHLFMFYEEFSTYPLLGIQFDGGYSWILRLGSCFEGHL